MFEFFASYPLWFSGFLLSLFAGLATALGAIPVFFIRTLSEKIQDIFMGVAAGVMLAATSFSLIVPALESAGNGVWAATIVVISILLGGLFLHFLDAFIPHEHFIKGPEGISSVQLKQLWLFVLAITIHNFPEGMAVGVGVGGGDIANGISLAMGIGLQNIPEGLVVALALIAHSYSKKSAFFIAFLTGLVEPVGGLLGAGIISLFSWLLPWGLAFAAGAMLFVISNEIIPESHSRGYAKQATFGVLIGFVIMLFLDVTLG